jgi:hypothetical protein
MPKGPLPPWRRPVQPTKPKRHRGLRSKEVRHCREAKQEALRIQRRFKAFVTGSKSAASHSSSPADDHEADPRGAALAARGSASGSAAEAATGPSVAAAEAATDSDSLSESSSVGAKPEPSSPHKQVKDGVVKRELATGARGGNPKEETHPSCAPAGKLVAVKDDDHDRPLAPDDQWRVIQFMEIFDDVP